jgi:hypothetical protein
MTTLPHNSDRGFFLHILVAQSRKIGKGGAVRVAGRTPRYRISNSPHWANFFAGWQLRALSDTPGKFPTITKLQRGNVKVVKVSAPPQTLALADFGARLN